MNVFQIQLGTGDPSLYLLDLPGYGFARASKGELTAFRGLLKHVVTRQRLAGVVWLLDIRRDPSPDDRAMQDAFAAAGIPGVRIRQTFPYRLIAVAERPD